MDNEGRQFLLLDEIIDWRKTEDALPEENVYQISLNNNIHKRRTTKGWELCVLWKDGSTSWEKLKDMKEGFPVQVADLILQSQGDLTNILLSNGGYRTL